MIDGRKIVDRCVICGCFKNHDACVLCNSCTVGLCIKEWGKDWDKID